ncbi:MAG: c-type cytochrome biogenesis protein CcsB [delta proteobacterium MLS_D]|jgi:cytochrome c-type biogenesis protein CcsB|nr:MAG: c-type cytochrome biogenesis protein CcsB [delta proteobacterium MLS_D]
MNDAFFVSIVTFIYFFAAFMYLVALVFRKTGPDQVAGVTAVAGLLLHSSALIVRWIESYRLGIGHAPLSNFYESMVFFSWSIVFVFFVMKKTYRTSLVGVIALFFAFIILAYVSLSGTVDCRIEPLIPALQSNWLISHVISSFLAYACFTIAFGLSVLYLLKHSATAGFARALPAASFLDEATHRIISIGFVLLTVGIITGAAWADRAWGRYWGWDPKETWSLITWLVYGAFLHARIARGWTGMKMSLISIIGFISMIFTYLGVNYILAGLHSYL